MENVTKARRRFMLLMMVAISITIGGALMAIYWFTDYNQEENNINRLNAFEELKVTEDGKFSFDGDNRDAYVVERTSVDIGPYFSMLVTQDGKLLSSFTNQEKQDNDFYQEAARIALEGENYSNVKLNGRIWQYSVSPAIVNMQREATDNNEQTTKQQTNHIRFIDITESQQMLKNLRYTLFFIGIALLGIFFLFSFFFSKLAIQPLIEVLDKQQQFIADASHELKTPLSIIKANANVLSSNKNQSVSEQMEWLEGINIGINRMTNLIDDLIKLVKIDEGNQQISQTPINLNKEITTAVELFNPLINTKSLNVKINQTKEIVFIQSNRELIQKVLHIVLDNAVKYTPIHGTIQIDLTIERKKAVVKIKNTGEGIVAENLEKIFERFYRGGYDRKHDGSYGLGLAIARTISRELGGSIKAESVRGESATFILRLPLNN